jgi:hypothetical protein
MRLAVMFLLGAWSAQAAANLVPNGSFEIGAGRGWMKSISGFYGHSMPIVGCVSNTGTHGSHSLRLEGRTISRGMWLEAGSVTMTFSAMAFPDAGPMFYDLVPPTSVQHSSGNMETASGMNSSTWTRYTNTFVIATAGMYHCIFEHFQNATMIIDAVQVEVGASATPFSPALDVECAIEVPQTNHFFSGDTPRFDLRLWNNTGDSSNTRVAYEVFDSWNSNVLSGALTVAVPANSAATETVNLPEQTGWFRVVSHLQTEDGSDEATLAVYPYAMDLDPDPDSILGTHTTANNFHSTLLHWKKYKHNRVLSPAYGATRWWNASGDGVEQTEGNFTFRDNIITNIHNAGIAITAPLTSSDGTWPQWSTNKTVPELLISYSNYVYVISSRYADVDCWEIWNEPYQSGPTTNPMSIRVATNYLKVAQVAIRVLTNTDPGCKIILIGGASGNGDWAYEVWTNLTASEQSAVYAISTHQYPPDNSASVDPELGVTSYGSANRLDTWVTTFEGSGVRLFNTESGSWQVGGMKGWNNMWPASYNLTATYTVEAQRSDKMHRTLLTLMRVSTQFLRTIGLGFSRYYYYDHRSWQAQVDDSVQPYSTDYMHVDAPAGVSLSIGTEFVYHGFGQVTNVNVSGTALEMYVYTNRTGRVAVAAWCADRGRKTLTLTNSAVAIYDVMGNQIATNVSEVLTYRLPVYLVSDTLSLTEMSNTVKYAAVASAADTLPPQVSIDIAPRGVGNPSGLGLLKWTALDAFRQQYHLTQEQGQRVNYDLLINNAYVLRNSQSNHFWVGPYLTQDGNTIFTIVARDPDGNESVTYHSPTGDDWPRLQLRR